MLNIVTREPLQQRRMKAWLVIFHKIQNYLIAIQLSAHATPPPPPPPPPPPNGDRVILTQI